MSYPVTRGVIAASFIYSQKSVYLFVVHISIHDPRFCFEPLSFKITCTLIYDYIISSHSSLPYLQSEVSVLIRSGSGWCIYRSMIPIQSCFCQSFQPPSPFVWQLSTVENRNTRGFWEDFLLCILRYTYWPPPLPAPEYRVTLRQQP